MGSFPIYSPRKAEADSLYYQVGKQFNHRKFKSAIQSCEKALNIYSEIGDSIGIANSLGSLGDAYYSLGPG